MPRFSRSELWELGLAWFVLSLSFSFGSIWFGLRHFAFELALNLLGLLTAFAGHELAHKFAAERYGCISYFRLWKIGLILALVFSFVTGGAFVFAAPGAVYFIPLYRTITRREEGIISLSGPLANLAFSLVFYSLLLLGVGGVFSYYSMKLNLWLAGFNLIPFDPLDGAKVFRWNPFIWVLAAAAAWILIFVL